ncbi:UDP-phosphate galactose phosphotransferase [Rhodobacteraceae bacterium (ex Bugula neritina AB1)]|nr:UDP-phosphate galactose phosphotransferase [Rhodobacteraceae bacterium (ex Bugula neritina AB1)]
MTLAYSSSIFGDGCAVKPRRLDRAYLPALDLNLADGSTDQAVAKLLSPGRRRVFFINAHCCNVRRRNPQYAKAVAAADLLLPDGIGVELAAKFTGHSLTANLNGTDFVPQLLQRAASMGKSVYLFGGRPGVADAAAARLVYDIPGLRIAGTRDGYQGAQDTRAVIADINESGASILLVALGVPKQELWLHRNAKHLKADLTLGVGALFDFLSGSVARAPEPVRAARMEWVWRLAMEPRRMARRYLTGNVSFLAHAGLAALRHKRLADLQQRALDITLAFSALLLLSPLLLLAALAVRADSKGAAIFKQTRVGLNGKTFTMYKFRSMTTDAEARRADVLNVSDRDGLCFKSRQDPRITRVGRWLRRTSTDELPQLFNVLRGEMSIVGPRPALPCEVADYPPRALGRLKVKPGITGVWQVSGRAAVGFKEMIEMDLGYIKARSLKLNLQLILRTFGAVISGRGAY